MAFSDEWRFCSSSMRREDRGKGVSRLSPSLLQNTVHTESCSRLMIVWLSLSVYSPVRFFLFFLPFLSHPPFLFGSGDEASAIADEDCAREIYRRFLECRLQRSAVSFASSRSFEASSVLCLCYHDVTSRRRGEEDSRYSTRRYRLLGLVLHGQVQGKRRRRKNRLIWGESECTYTGP